MKPSSIWEVWAVQFNDPIEIFGPRNCFHIAARFQNLNFFRFLKPLCCSYYTVCKEYMQDAGFKIVNFFIFWNCVYGTITSRDSIMSRLMNSDDYWMGSLTYYENHCICTWFRNRNLQPPRQNKIGLLFQDFFHTACEGWYVPPYIRSRFIPVYCGHSSHCLVPCRNCQSAGSGTDVGVR